MGQRFAELTDAEQVARAGRHDVERDSGATSLEELMHSHPGELKAEIYEEEGQVFMGKTCPTHGEFKDTLATDAKFLERVESLFFGRDFRSAED